MTGITLENITKVFGSGATAATAVDRVSLKVAPGEFYFLLGPSGCGKTTLLRMVAGLIAPNSGRVLFAGRDVTAEPVEKRGTALVFQNYALWPHMTVLGNVEFGPRMQHRERTERRKLARQNLELVRMAEYEHRKPKQLSGGQQQRVALARALAAQPQCLLLDEPLSNLDAQLRLHMREELRHLVKSTGTTAIYVTHDQKEALSMADRIAVMNAGRLVQVGSPEELYEQPADRFVASFIGEANFIAGTAGAPGRQHREITTEAGCIAAMPRRLVAAGEPVLCCVRPEKLLIGAAMEQAAAGDMPSALAADVIALTYLGDTIQYRCRLADGTEWKVAAVTAGGAPLAPGTRAFLSVAPANVIVLPAQ